MDSSRQERRRYPRLSVAASTTLRTSRHLRVRLLDLSSNGALLEAPDRLTTGTKGRLRLALGPSTFEASVEVTRQGSTVDGQGRVAGVSLAATAPGQQGILDDFLRRAGS